MLHIPNEKKEPSKGVNKVSTLKWDSQGCGKGGWLHQTVIEWYNRHVYVSCHFVFLHVHIAEVPLTWEMADL